jgi:Holliday junction DNA helicase RuvA
MIGRLNGVLVEKNPPQLTLEVQGVGYEVDVPMSTFYNLPAVGERVTLYTHLQVREDAHLLYGFASEAERKAFRQLLKISGVGARTALSLLSGMSVAELVQAVAMQEAGRLIKVPGIGKKTAERLLLELKDKLGAEITAGVAVNRAAPAADDVLNALLALGYNEKEARYALKQLPEGLGVSEGIRHALKALARSWAWPGSTTALSASSIRSGRSLSRACSWPSAFRCAPALMANLPGPCSCCSFWSTRTCCSCAHAVRQIRSRPSMPICCSIACCSAYGWRRRKPRA